MVEDKYLPVLPTLNFNAANQPIEESKNRAEEEIEVKNTINGSLRSCYVNEVKSAKELKISIKGGQHVYFYPNI